MIRNRIGIAALAAICALSSCREGWSSEYRDMYLEACRTSGNAMKLDTAGRSRYCRCSLEQVMQVYPDLEDALNNQDSTRMSAALKQCMDQAISP